MGPPETLLPMLKDGTLDFIPSQLNIVLTIDSLKVGIEAIRSHLGLGVIVTHLIDKEINDGSIVPIKISSKKIINKIAFFQLLHKKTTLTEKMFQIHFQNEISKSGLSRL